MSPDHLPIAPLSDGQISLRPFSPADAAAVTAACQDPEISRWTSAIPWPYGEDDARNWIASHPKEWESGASAPFAITDASGELLLGSVGLHDVDRAHRDAAIGYWVAKEARGNNVATRAVVLATDWAFTRFGLEALDLLTKLGNAASERVAEKAGYRYLSIVTDVPAALDPHQRFDAKRWVATIPGAAVREWGERA